MDIIGFGYGTSSIIIFFLAVIAAALVTYFFLNKNRKGNFKGFAGKVSDLFNFTEYLVPLILKVLYAFATAYTILNGLYVLLSGSIYGLVSMIIGPIIVRIGFELIMLLYSIREELSRIRKASEDKTSRTDGQDNP
jgi:hypothetical protein